MMKAKKWMALALSAVMAVGMLTGCGGGGTASNRSAMTVSQVNSALRKVDSEAKAKTLDDLNEAVEATADYMLSRGVRDANTLLGFIAAERGYREDSTKYGTAFVVSDKELEAGVSASSAASAIASQVGLSVDIAKIEELGTLDSPEKAAAAVILGVDEGLKQWSDNPFFNIGNVTYAVSGRKVTMPNDAVYYLIVVEMNTASK
ncbi:hypothetical protein [Faecalibacterium sp. An192]|uniref:hypothetical protein n=1 Tax=Faecalibacterium sp. An192 TaxID=1965581 RepID=UPI000B39B5AC|nr:hypothetical protein [Faecalibacterium sp. An192]OUP28050.1 hypothetical protein B5F27_08055 [Faecalibacterium sp. An192]